MTNEQRAERLIDREDCHFTDLCPGYCMRQSMEIPVRTWIRCCRFPCYTLTAGGHRRSS